MQFDTLCTFSGFGVGGISFTVPNTLWELLEKDTKEEIHSLEQEMAPHLEMMH